MITAHLYKFLFASAAYLSWKYFRDFFRKQYYHRKMPNFASEFNRLRKKTTNSSEIFKLIVSLTRKFSQETKSSMFAIIVGPVSSVFAIHPDAYSAILKSQKHLTKASRYKQLESWLGEGLVMSTGKKWQQRRKIVTPSFHSDMLKSFVGVMNEQADIFVAKVDQLNEQGREIDIARLLKMCTLDVICETAMGVKIFAQKDEDHPYNRALEGVAHTNAVRNRIPMLRFDFIFRWTEHYKQQKDCLKVVTNFTQSVIRERIKQKGEVRKEKMFLDVLLDAETEGGEKLSTKAVQEEVDTFMFAGHDTSSTTLNWTIYVLGRYPEVQRKLQREIDAVFGGNFDADVTIDQMKDLRYMDMVVKEVLRLYPPAAFVGRQLEEDCVVDGTFLPRGTDFTVFIHFVHRHPDIWTRPDDFLPERFDPECPMDAGKSHFAYIPFSAGPRNCVGQRFAMQEVRVILVKFFSKFSVVSHTREEDLEIKTGLVFEVKDRLDITITKREI